jgi:DNA-binding NtrC family response regulator
MARSSSAPADTVESLEPLSCQPPKPGILVVDDEESVRNLLRVGLRRSGFEVYLASNGAEAVALYRQEQQAIAVVLLDVRMPVLDGPEALSALQAINPGVRACFMSGSMGHYEAHDLLGRGAWSIFVKPFDLDEVAGVLWQIAAGAARSASPGRVKEEGPANDS